jgi:C_GCAxxG_C_C family probable redox protein
MGHCAPSVARTLTDGAPAGVDWLVRLAAGLPGGIGNTGGECGAVTASLLVLGLRSSGRVDGLPVVVEQGQALCRRFESCHGSLFCRDILGTRRLPLPCIGVVRRAPELLAATAGGAGADVAAEARRAGAQLLEHLARTRFHCAQAVLCRLAAWFPVTPELLDATSAFAGGMVLQGLTCSALAAGVMGLGLAAGEIEDSLPRVARLLATMAFGGDALRDDLNSFNPSVNRGRRLASWFAREFGSTQCRALTRCDFSSETGVARFIQRRQAVRCDLMAARVAEQTTVILGRARAHGAGGPGRVT